MIFENPRTEPNRYSVSGAFLKYRYNLILANKRVQWLCAFRARVATDTQTYIWQVVDEVLFFLHG
jgi:hypothetical protein